MMVTVPHVTSGLGLRKFEADGFLLTRVYRRPAVTGLHYTYARTFQHKSLHNITMWHPRCVRLYAN